MRTAKDIANLLLERQKNRNPLFADIIDDVIYFLEHVETENDALKRFINDTISDSYSQCWIFVDELLPKLGQKVIICGIKGGIQVGSFSGTFHSFTNKLWWWKGNTVCEVTHWMPLPEPPKAQKE